MLSSFPSPPPPPPTPNNEGHAKYLGHDGEVQEPGIGIFQNTLRFSRDGGYLLLNICPTPSTSSARVVREGCSEEKIAQVGDKELNL